MKSLFFTLLNSVKIKRVISWPSQKTSTLHQWNSKSDFTTLHMYAYKAKKIKCLIINNPPPMHFYPKLVKWPRALGEFGYFLDILGYMIWSCTWNSKSAYICTLYAYKAKKQQKSECLIINNPPYAFLPKTRQMATCTIWYWWCHLLIFH